jgi:hypothetical protein
MSEDTPLEAGIAIAGTVLVVLLVLAQAPTYYGVVFKVSRQLVFLSCDLRACALFQVLHYRC